MAEKRKSRGIVLNFHDVKGYGFIKLDGAGEEEPDIFVHHSEVKADGHRTLRSGQEVEFLMYQDGDKLKAVDVVVVGGRVSGGRGDGFNRRIGNGYHGGNVGGGGGECYTCGKPGHFSRDCYETSGGNVGGGGGGSGSGVCYTCGGIGHLARECPTGRKRGCFNCGNPGHIAADCREITNGSYQSGGGGNAAGRGFSSYGGNGGGGLSFSRFGGNVKSCFNCGEQGHMAKDCQEVSRGDGGRGGNANTGGFSQRNCFKCGEPGHFARECLSVK